MSACLGHSAQLFGWALFWLFLSGCIWMRFAFKLVVIWIKQIALHKVGEPQLISWKPKVKKKGWPSPEQAEILQKTAFDFICNSGCSWFYSRLPLVSNGHSFLSLQPAISTIRFYICQTSTFTWTDCLKNLLIYLCTYQYINTFYWFCFSWEL